jgi:hypothetical protein
MTGPAQADPSASDAGSGHPRCFELFRDGPIRRDSVRGVVVWVELTPIGVRNSNEIERDVTAFARGPNGGLQRLPVDLNQDGFRRAG